MIYKLNTFCSDKLGVEFSYLFCYTVSGELSARISRPSKEVFLIITIDFTDKEFRRLLDMVYIGNWVLNSIRGEDRFTDYDKVENKVFAQCIKNEMFSLIEIRNGVVYPSPAFEEGGIHEAIMDYEDSMFFEILAEELARKDMDSEHISPDDFEELHSRIEGYISEFEENGIENVSVEY